MITNPISPPNAEPFDDTAKDFYRQLFASWGLTVASEQEVFFRGRAIDLVVSGVDEAQQQRLQTSIFKYFRRLNALEFKGVHDPLTVVDYNKIMMRVWGLGAVQENLPAMADRHLTALPSQRTLTIICVTKPEKILHNSPEFWFVPTDEPGIYHCASRIEQWLIHPSELALIPANYPLLPLARGQKLAAFLQLCLQQGLFDYIWLTLRIGLLADPVNIWQQLLQVQRMEASTLELHEAVIPYIERYFQTYPEDLTRLAITNALLAEQLKQGLQQGLQQGVQQGLQQGVQQGLQQGLQQGVQQGLQQGVQQGVQQGEATLLRRLLQKRFGQLPNWVEERLVQAKSEQLEQWSLRLLEVNTLEEIWH
jgi:hypothetical protein